MAGISGGTVFVNVVANIGPFRQQMLGLSGQLSTFGSTISRVGTAMSRGVTLPLGLAGFAATKLAVDYDAAFTKISAVTSASSTDIAKWREEVLALATTTGQGPEELAQALYFLASAGLDTSQIMEALDASAKASAVGLGETGDIARLTANVLNAYSGSALKAADVTDILTAAVREGTAEPDEFASAMGRLLPIASKAKVEFNNLAASLAVVSNIGLDVSEGVTAMRGLLQALVAPGTAASEAMKSIGYSATDLREILADDGLLGAVRAIEDATKEKFGEAWLDTARDIIPNIRALTGALGLTVQEADKVDGVFQAVVHSVGDAGEAFETTKRESEQFKLDRLMAQLKVLGIQFGEVIIPFLNDFIEGLQSVIEWFGNLSEGTKHQIIVWGLWLAALGPVARIFGTFITLLSGAVQAGRALYGFIFTKMIPAFKAGGAAGATFGRGLAAGVAGFAAAAAKIAGVIALGGYVFNIYEDLTTGTEELAAATGLTTENVKALEEQIARGATKLNPFTSTADKVREAAEIANEVIKDLAESTGSTLYQAQKKVNEIFQQSIVDIGGITGSMDTLEQNLRGRLGLLETADAITLATRRFEALIDAAEIAGSSSPAEQIWNFQTFEAQEFVAAIKSVNASGLNTAAIFGDQVREALNTVNEATGKSLIIWPQVVRWWERAGVAAPFQQAGDFAEGIFRMNEATDEQRAALAGAIGMLDKYGIEMSGAVESWVNSEIFAGDANAAIKRLNDSLGSEAIDAVLSHKDALNKAQLAWAAEKIAAGEYLAVLQKITAIERARRQREQAEARAAREDRWRLTGGELNPTAGTGGDVRAQIDQINQLLDMEPKLRSWRGLLESALGAEGVDFSRIKTLVQDFGELGVKFSGLSKAFRKKLEVLLDAGKAQEAAELLLLKLVALDKTDAKPKVTLEDGNTNSELSTIYNQLHNIDGFTARAAVILTHQIIEGHHSGGFIGEMHSGGLASDERSAVLQTGEFVMSRRAVKRLGRSTLETLNSGGGAALVGTASAGDGTTVTVKGDLHIKDWRSGLAELQGELQWMDRGPRRRR